MTLDVRRLVIVSAFLVGLCVLPAVSAAQDCQFEYGIYAALDYEHISEDSINLFSMGAGIDYSNCGACGHGYSVEYNVTRLPETNIYTDYSSETEYNVPIFGLSLTTEPESFRVDFSVLVYCWCALTNVGQPTAQATVQVPRCNIPFESYKGPSRGRPILYQIVTG